MPIFNSATRGRVLFIHIPKTGGSSIEMWLKEEGYQCDKLDYTPAQGMLNQHAPKVIYDTWGKFDYKFAIVRDPMDRFISAFANHSVRSENLDTTGRDVLHKYEAGNISAWTWGNWFLPQVNFISDDVEIFRFEDDFFPQLGKALSISKTRSYPRINQARTTINRSHISEVLKQRIHAVYDEDYAALGYSKE